jgi:hypothetical protein
MDLFGRIAAQRLGQARSLRPALAPHFAPDEAPLAAARGGRPGEVNDERIAEASAAQGVSNGTPVTARRSAFENVPGTSTARAPMTPVHKHADTFASGVGLGVEGPLQAASEDMPPRVAPAPAGEPRPPTSAGMRNPATHALPLRTLHHVAPLAAPTAPLAPERAAMLGAPAQPPRVDAAPVVHVHIDHIDVGAPAATAAPAPRAARPAPARSLADYLREGARR